MGMLSRPSFAFHVLALACALASGLALAQTATVAPPAPTPTIAPAAPIAPTAPTAPASPPAPEVSPAKPLPASADSLAQLNAVLWMQQTLEYKAVSQSVYAAATRMLPAAVKQRTWATLERGPAKKRRAAVVLDLDETALDNSAYNAWKVRADQPYREGDWQAWMALQAEQPVPGVLAFTLAAKRAGADVFYITNRECHAEGADPCPAKAHTMARMARLGFPRASDPAAFLFKNEEPGWASSDKSPRRLRVLQTHRIVMQLGDDLRDFLPMACVDQLRGPPVKEKVKAACDVGKAEQAMQAFFGQSWFMLPNPSYGSWEKGVPAKVEDKLKALQVPAAWSAPGSGPK